MKTLLTTLLFVILSSVAMSQSLKLKCFSLKSSMWDDRTSDWSTILDWQKSDLIFTIEGNMLSVDNVNESRYFTSNTRSGKDTYGHFQRIYDAVDKNGKSCVIKFTYPKIKEGQAQWNWILIIYNDILWSYKVRVFNGLDSYFDEQ